MHDVAQLAGVSPQTVSRVSRGRTNVDAKTRERVLAAMRQLGYRPNRAARALKSGRFRSIAVVASLLPSYGSRQWVSAIAIEAARAGYSVTLVALESTEPDSVATAFDTLAEHSVDGVVLLLEHSELEAAKVSLPQGLPAVGIDSGVDSPYPIVDNDQALGARLATQHLLDLGHRTVYHLSGPHDSHSARVRERAWRETLESAGRRVPSVIRGDWSPEAGYAAGLQLAAVPEATAIFAADDQMALGVLRGLRELGRDVPGDVSVVGFDDVPEAANYQPPLTTIHQFFDRIGATCVSVLVDEIERGKRRFPPLVPVELIIRSSTAAPTTQPPR
jgi:DNA-binding LacI/PurR family transcriptional regulator